MKLQQKFAIHVLIQKKTRGLVKFFYQKYKLTQHQKKQCLDAYVVMRLFCTDPNICTSEEDYVSKDFFVDSFVERVRGSFRESNPLGVSDEMTLKHIIERHRVEISINLHLFASCTLKCLRYSLLSSFSCKC